MREKMTMLDWEQYIDSNGIQHHIRTWGSMGIDPFSDGTETGGFAARHKTRAEQAKRNYEVKMAQAIAISDSLKEYRRKAERAVNEYSRKVALLREMIPR